MLRLYNTASRSLEEFKPLMPGKVSMYTCGPTVYWDATIGNFRTFVFEDVLQRTLELDGFAVTRVLNITDVGHLVSDSDEGQDKMEKASAKEGMTAWDVAKKYTQLFLEDAAKLNVKIPPAPYLARATDFIPQQIALVKTLEEKGFTYKTSDGIYFDTSKFPSYGKLGGQKLEDKEAGARVEANPEKKHKSDFALWKFSNPTAPNPTPTPTPSPKRQMEWDSPWGVGFPGWHIECSAMAHEFLGQPIDIHCGGMDLIPVHHENEIAQSEAAFGKKFVDYWVHGEFLNVDGGKMSKSLGNVYTVRDLEAKGFNPLALRLFFLGAHYRAKENFTWEALQASQNALSKLYAAARELPKPTSETPDAEFQAALDDDLNTSRALAAVWKLLDADTSPQDKSSTLVWMDRVLGLGLADVLGKPIEIPEEIKALNAKRDQARADKDWKTSDELRDEMLTKGWTVEDTSAGSKLLPKTPS